MMLASCSWYFALRTLCGTLALGELPRQVLRALDAGGTDQDRLALFVALGDVVDDGDVLGFLGLVDQVGLVGRGPSRGSVGIATTPSL